MPLVALGHAGGAQVPRTAVLGVTRRSHIRLRDVICFLVTGRALFVLLDDIRLRLTNIGVHLAV